MDSNINSTILNIRSTSSMTPYHTQSPTLSLNDSSDTDIGYALVAALATAIGIFVAITISLFVIKYRIHKKIRRLICNESSSEEQAMLSNPI